MYQQQNKSSIGLTGFVVWLYAALVRYWLVHFMVEYRNIQLVLFFDVNYSKAIVLAGICIIIATFILLSDSKLYTAFLLTLCMFWYCF